MIHVKYMGKIVIYILATIKKFTLSRIVLIGVLLSKHS